MLNVGTDAISYTDTPDSAAATTTSATTCCTDSAYLVVMSGLQNLAMDTPTPPSHLHLAS